jgi:NTP pyrophosphatase (non-canonical NTP hydrolase)
VSFKPLVCEDQMIQYDFIRLFQLAQSGAFDVNTLNGWWDDRNTFMESRLPGAVPMVVIGCLGLVGTEVSEAIEAVRKQSQETWGDAKTKDTLVRELAGTIVRCMDLAERLDLPLAEAIVEEIKRNAERGFRHGGKAA